MFIIEHHFEPSKVGMLARCLCILLVSIRVGKINKQGTLLCPTSTRNCIMSYMPWTDLNKIIGASNRKRTTQMLLKECVLLGAIPFPADVERLKDLGVCEVITLTEPYETLVPTSLYQVRFCFRFCFFVF
ncbi:hypothetical protein ACSBR1_003186 [Camellia fascicularis]